MQDTHAVTHTLTTPLAHVGSDNSAAFASSERGGLTATIVCATISFISVSVLLLYILIRSFLGSRKQRLMGDRHMTAYFTCVLVASAFKSFSVVMSVQWLFNGLRITPGTYCTLQAGMKLVGNVGSSLWSMIIAVHVFQLLFLEMRTLPWALPATVVAVWAMLLVDVLVGPVFFNKPSFFGPDPRVSQGSTCWITAAHPHARFLLEYLPTGLALATTTVLMLGTLLHLRGNIYWTGGRMKLRWLNKEDAWHNRMTRAAVDERVLSTVARMIWFPISYFILWAPVMISRLMDLSGDKQPFGFVAFALSCYALTGAADVVIFLLTRHVLIPQGVVAPALAEADEALTPDDEKKAPLPFDDEKKAPLPPAFPSAFVPVHAGPPPTAPPAGPLPLPPARSNSLMAPPAFPRALVLSTPRHARSSTISVNSVYSQRTIAPSSMAPRAVAPPTAFSDVSMIHTGHRYSSSLSTASSRPTNFLSVGSDTPRTGPMGSDGTETPAHAGILSAYSRPSAPLTGSDASTGLDFASARSARSGWGNRADENVTPLGPEETYKAQMYGARFSLVAGPAPSYNLDRPTRGIAPGDLAPAPGA